MLYGPPADIDPDVRPRARKKLIARITSRSATPNKVSLPIMVMSLNLTMWMNVSERRQAMRQRLNQPSSGNDRLNT
jgi:hypothetical protein